MLVKFEISPWKLKTKYGLPTKSVLLPTVMNEIRNLSAFHLPNRHDLGTLKGEAFAYLVTEDV